jgi:hypothetical protein
MVLKVSASMGSRNDISDIWRIIPSITIHIEIPTGGSLKRLLKIDGKGSTFQG